MKQEVVHNSALDNSVCQVENWFSTNLKDPDSVQVIRWGEVKKVGDGYIIQVKFRAKNSFGAYEISHMVFQLDPDGVIYSAFKMGG